MLANNGPRSYRRTIREVAHIALRHIFLPINAIIFAVVGLLVLFGQVHEGLFLGAIVLLNILLGFGQDVRAWLTLENLQFLTALKIIRINPDDTETQVLLEQLTKGDRIRLKLGDQMPCDGVMVSDTTIEVNEGLITGESQSFVRSKGESILAGSVVTSGQGIAKMATSFQDSRIARMATGLKRYSANPSPIQLSIATIIRYTTYVLLSVSAIVVVRGILLHQPNVRIVESIGALAGVLVPQGLVVAVTLLFTFGAAHFFRRNVLLQEVNATEKFGRIKNLCMDKTGTLTENAQTVESMQIGSSVSEKEAREYAALYAQYSGDESQSIRAVGAFLGAPPEREITDDLPFSSTRLYGGICVANTDISPSTVVFVGAPETLASHLAQESERAWLLNLVSTQAKEGKHLLCVALCEGTAVPRMLEGCALSVGAVFVLGNKLREGIQGAVDFFQNRGVTIRILTGDHPETARVVAKAAGIHNADKVIKGEQMIHWSEADYVKNVHNYAIFARIQPEQKEKIIDALKLDGFTAMVGDGANDALSVKKADLGIAMFDGATATRQIAAVVLMNNSFVELPGGVRLADSMIENIEIFASAFLSQTFVAFFFFALLTLFGFDFPLTPLNINFINYFTVGIPGMLISWWAINPNERTAPASTRPFLERIVPFSLGLAIIQTLAILAVFMLGHEWAPTDEPIGLLVVAFVALGFAFFILAARFYSRGLDRTRILTVLALGVSGSVILYAALHISVVLTFFGLVSPSRQGTLLALSIAAVFCVIQYVVARGFFSSKQKRLLEHVHSSKFISS